MNHFKALAVGSIFASILAIGGVALADKIELGAVPAPVTKAFAARYPKLTPTKAEKEVGKDKVVTFELKADKTEATFTADGTFLEEEMVVAVTSLPAAVTKAFAAKYPKAKADRAEKQVKADKTTTYELAFASAKGRTEATFKDDGSFVEEE
jgi:multimeric flavodoxin WrbA